MVFLGVPSGSAVVVLSLRLQGVLSSFVNFFLLLFENKVFMFVLSPTLCRSYEKDFLLSSF